MKKLIVLIIIVLVAIGGYSMWGGKSSDNSAKDTAERSRALSSEGALRLNASLDSYEALIESYEKSGINDQSRMLQFVADTQQWGTTWSGDMTGVSADEASYLQNRLQALTARQMKMMGR